MVVFRCYINNHYVENGVLKVVDCFQEVVQEVVDKAESLGGVVEVTNIIEPEDKIKEGVVVKVKLPEDRKADFSIYMIEYYSEFSWQLGRDEYYYEIDEDSVSVHIGS